MFISYLPFHLSHWFGMTVFSWASAPIPPATPGCASVNALNALSEGLEFESLNPFFFLCVPFSSLTTSISDYLPTTRVFLSLEHLPWLLRSSCSLFQRLAHLCIIFISLFFTYDFPNLVFIRFIFHCIQHVSECLHYICYLLIWK